ncbi:hypothetical protein [Sphingomonas sp.]|uniref:hypothetical protein n=1 Tax=Sphingomonas sp. TaxID=28214 RepID=UPI003D6CB179
MIRNLLSLTAIMLTGFADPQEPPSESRSAATPDRISYTATGNGWTGGRTEWWIDHSGRGMYRTTVRHQAGGEFNAGPAGFARIRAILQPLEEVRELPCDGAVTDQGMGTLSWRRSHGETSLRFDFGCNFRQPDAARAQLGQASELVQKWALAR